jgi:hypothetical protein
MSLVEQVQYRGFFPKLKVEHTLVTAEATPRYNCIAWSVGITHHWLWPGDAMEDFDYFYSSYGFEADEEGEISLWGLGPYAMSHACRLSEQHLDLWESKCGAGLRILHSLEELEGEAYGRHWKFFRKTLTSGKIKSWSMKEAQEMTTYQLSGSERSALEAQIRLLPPFLQHTFQHRFQIWKATWFAGILAIDSNPASRARGPAFRALLEMGPEILPLVVREMLNPEHFFALQLFERLQNDPSLHGFMAAEHQVPYGMPLSEQEKTVNALRQYFREL